MHNNRPNISRSLGFLTALMLLLSFYSCAKMGQPDGGWYDETPPRIVGCTPADGSVCV